MPVADSVSVTDDTLSVNLSDGRTILVPTAWYPRLLHATPKEKKMEADWQGARDSLGRYR